jgi:hypothetical protein
MVVVVTTQQIRLPSLMYCSTALSRSSYEYRNYRHVVQEIVCIPNIHSPTPTPKDERWTVSGHSGGRLNLPFGANIRGLSGARVP